MATRSNALVDLINQKIIVTAFCNPIRNNLPVTTCCRYRTTVAPGSARFWTCDRIVEHPQINRAFALIEDLNMYIPPDAGLECDFVYQSETFRKHLHSIVSLLVCPEHAQAQDAIQTVTLHYLEAIRSTALNELTNAQSLYQRTSEMHKTRIANGYNQKHPRPTAPAKSSYSTTSLPQQQNNNPYVQPQYPGGSQKRKRTVRPDIRDAFVENPTKRPTLRFPTRPWVIIFQTYHRFWTEVENDVTKFISGEGMAEQIRFPVHSGDAEDVTEQAVEEFLHEALQRQIDKMSFLKKERLRWHPDKIDQRFNGLQGAEKVKEMAGMIIQQINRFADAEKGGNEG